MRLTLAVLVFAIGAVAQAHPGGLDKHGCHRNRKTGSYHCHRAQPASPAKPSPEKPTSPVDPKAPDAKPKPKT